eukprot:547251_1
MVLDLKKFQLRYIVNGKDYGVAFKVERTTYRAAVSMKQRTAVEIVIPGAKLGSMNKMNDDDAKCNKCDRFKTQITKLIDRSLQQCKSAYLSWNHRIRKKCKPFAN